MPRKTKAASPPGSESKSTPTRSILYWSNPDWKAKITATAHEHGMKESPFLETLVLAAFDPLHFTRLMHWLYPQGHPAFNQPAGDPERVAELEREIADLSRELEETRQERDRAEARVATLEDDLREAFAAERAARDRLLDLQDVMLAGVQAAREAGGDFMAESPYEVVQVVERLLRERRRSRPRGKPAKPEVSEILIIEEMARRGVKEAEVRRQLRNAVTEGFLKQNGSRYHLPPGPRSTPASKEWDRE